MLPRRLRVMRAKAVKKRAERPRQSEREKEAGILDRSMQGRASKLLGRAGAAQIRKGVGKRTMDPMARTQGNGEPPSEEVVGENEGQAVVFEGHRAKAHDRVAGLKVGRKGKRKGKPSTRSTKRAAAWRKTQEAKP
jgi:nucleolar protein 12